MKLNGRDLLPIVQEPGGPSTRGPHRLASAMLCGQKTHERYIEEIVPLIKAEIPTMGSLIHLHQAFYWSARIQASNPKLTPPWFFTFNLDKALEKEAKGYPHLLEQCDNLMEQFAKDNRGDTWKAVAVEEEIRLPLSAINPDCPEYLRDEVVSLRMDVVFENEKGYHIPLDYKSVASAWNGALRGWDPEDAFMVDWQVGMHLHLLPIAKPEWNVDSMCIQRILQVPSYQSDRNPVRFPKPFMDQMPELITRAVAKDYEIAHLGPLKDGVITGACFSRWVVTEEKNYKGRPCEYRDLCLAENDKVRKMIKKDGYKKREY